MATQDRAAAAETLLANIYAAFNQRRIDDALAMMSERVSWPTASEGGRVVGKEAIRAYWMRQWQEFDPHVAPVQISLRDDGRAEVRVRQIVRSLAGDILSDSEVRHVYTLADGLIDRMDIEGGDAGAAPSAAFSRH